MTAKRVNLPDEHDSTHKSGLRWLWLAVLAFVLDQAGKLAVVQDCCHLVTGVEIAFFNLVHVYSKGAAFQLSLADQGVGSAGSSRCWLFFAICGLLIHWLRKQSVTSVGAVSPIHLIIGGSARQRLF